MRNEYFSIFLLFLVITHSDFTINSFGQSKKNNKIAIRLINIADSTILYLYAEEKKIDSTMMINGRGKIINRSLKPEEVYISNDDRKNFQFKLFWSESSQIKIIGDYQNMKKAEVRGSKSNDLSEKYFRIDTIYRGMLKNQNNRAKKQTNTLLNREFFNLVKNNNNSTVTLFWLGWKCKDNMFSKQEIAVLFNLLSMELKKGRIALNIKEYISSSTVPKVGEKYVDFEQQSVDNKKIKLSDYKGKLILLEFWSSSCGPCRNENPFLVELYNKYHPKGFEILGISLDTDKKNGLTR